MENEMAPLTDDHFAMEIVGLVSTGSEKGGEGNLLFTELRPLSEGRYWILATVSRWEPQAGRLTSI